MLIIKQLMVPISLIWKSNGSNNCLVLQNSSKFLFCAQHKKETYTSLE